MGICKKRERKPEGLEKNKQEERGTRPGWGVGMGEEEGLSQVTVGSADFTKF